ncbi:MAG TPA: undecaprenyl-phosphate glucose phosphotransferase [Ardenticatenaceae bacterium]|nr:undecaprenyl-phosphate glucose phosphotransferase [Ardenticatenaceae bacterium]
MKVVGGTKTPEVSEDFERRPRQAEPGARRRVAHFPTWTRVFAVLVDAALINLAFFTAYWMRYRWELGGQVDLRYQAPYQGYLPFALLVTAFLLLTFALQGLYHSRRGATLLDEVYTIFNGVTTSTVLLMAVFFIYRPLSFSRLLPFFAALMIVVYLALARVAERALRGRLRRRGIGVIRVLIVGAGEMGRTIMRHIVAQPELGYQVVGFVDDDPTLQHNIGRFHALGYTGDLARVVQQHGVDEVIITLPWQHHRKIVRIVDQCQDANVRSRIVPDLFQLSLTRVELDDIKGVPLIGIKEPSLQGWNMAFKRVMDIVIAAIGLVLSAPLLLLIALGIKVSSPGPILFKQTRVGRNGQLFTLYKFRSMRVGAENEVAHLSSYNEADGPLFKMRRDPRVTPVGRILRKLSLDELPQLYNVLRGEMSLVGPRPALPSEVAQYEEWHRKRLEVPPGITGLWQTSGRSDMSFDEMCLLDIYYAEQWSPILDATIVLKTIPTMLFGRGAY